MLETMRKHSESFFIYLIFGGIIVVFAVNFGPGSSSCRGQNDGDTRWAATVDGEPIPTVQWSRNYDFSLNMQRRRMQMAGINFSAEMIERMGLRKQALDQLIDQKLLAQEARRWGLKVDDQQLRDYIKSRYTAVEEMTSRRDYENWVGQVFQTTVQGFESDTRDEILGQQLHQMLMQSVSVSEDELQSDYMREHDRVMASYVKFDGNQADSAEPSNAELNALIAGEMSVVEEKYNNEVMRYRTAQKVEARHILRKLAADASDADIAAARGLLLELKSQIQGGADFAALAAESSQDDVTKDKGGALGEIAQGSGDPALDAVLFDLKQDEMSAEPVRTKDGLHLLQVTKIIPPTRKPLEEVKVDIAKEIYKERRAAQQAKKAAEELLAKLAAGSSLESLTISEADARENKDAMGDAKKTDQAKKAELPVRHETSWVLKSEKTVPRIGASDALHAKLFQLTEEAPLAEEVFEVNGSYYVVQLKERETPNLDEFKKQMDDQKGTAITVKQGRVYRDWLEHLKQTASIKYNPALFPPAEEGQDNTES